MSHKAKIENPRPATKWRTKVSDENPALLKKAQKELNENPEQRAQDIQTLRGIILGEKGLKSPTEDAFLVKFLRVRKFYIERAFELLKQYYSIRNKYPNIFTNYRPSSLVKLYSTGPCFLLPYRDQLGRAILVLRPGKWDPAIYSFDEYLAAIHMSVEHALMQEETQVNGFLIIGDMKDFGLRQAYQITPNSAKKTLSMLQDCLPGRLKGIHYIFEPVIFGLVFMIVKPFFNKKTKSRIRFHGYSVESLHEHIDPECLPEEYGGLQPSYEVAAELHAQALLAREDEIVNFMENSGYPDAQAIN